MILISDSGSTKTDWVLSDGGTVMRRVRTEGINPFHQSVERIDGIIHENLLPSIGDVDIEKFFTAVAVRRKWCRLYPAFFRMYFPMPV